MTKRITSFRIAVASVLVMALVMSGTALPSMIDHSPQVNEGMIAYADTTTDGAVTEPEPASADIATAAVTGISDKYYTGKSIKPEPKVAVAGKKLKKDRDYTVKYQNVKLPGTASVVIKGKSPNYTGTKTVTFKISIAPPRTLKLKADSDYVTSKWKKADGKISGYKVTYSNDKAFKSKKTVELKASTLFYNIARPYYDETYYVKARSFTKIGKKIYYSAYSEVQSVKTKTASWFSKISNKISKNEKWIELDVSKQILYIHKGKENIVKRMSCSSGKPSTPTPLGLHSVYKKIKLHDMKGDWDPVRKKWGYVTPNVKWSTYFISDCAFHTAYWNPQVNTPVDSKRTPVSHGCINLSEKNAKFIYDWAPMGTLVYVHK